MWRTVYYHYHHGLYAMYKTSNSAFHQVKNGRKPSSKESDLEFMSTPVNCSRNFEGISSICNGISKLQTIENISDVMSLQSSDHD